MPRADGSRLPARGTDGWLTVLIDGPRDIARLLAGRRARGGGALAGALARGVADKARGGRGRPVRGAFAAGWIDERTALRMIRGPHPLHFTRPPLCLPAPEGVVGARPPEAALHLWNAAINAIIARRSGELPWCFRPTTEIAGMIEGAEEQIADLRGKLIGEALPWTR